MPESRLAATQVISIRKWAYPRLPDELRPFGYPSSKAFSAALEDFVDVHLWTFKAMAKAVVLQRGGIDRSQSTNEMLYIHLTPGIASGVSTRNPAYTFKFKCHSLGTFNPDNLTPPVLELPTREWCQHIRDSMNLTHRSHPRYTGCLPVMFYVNDACFGLVTFFPLFRPADDCSVIGMEREAVLDDILNLCDGSFYAGTPLRSVEVETEDAHGTSVVALPGCSVCSKGSSWTWEPLCSRWKDYQPGKNGALDEVLGSMKAGDVEALMTTFGSM